MKLSKPSRNRTSPTSTEGEKTARRIVNVVLTLAALAVISLGGIGGYALYGISGMVTGIMLGAVVAFLVF